MTNDNLKITTTKQRKEMAKKKDRSFDKLLYIGNIWLPW